MVQIIIKPADPAWAGEFARLKPAILSMAPAGAVIHHIGSTAVPGLPAKDVIDIQLTVDALSDVDGAAIEAQGFRERFGRVDHCPPGLNLLDVELQKRFFAGTRRRVHLHVRQREAVPPALLSFKPRFPADPSMLRRCLCCYQAAARASFSRQRGCLLRYQGPGLRYHHGWAEEWARHVGWSLPPGD